MTTRSAIRGKTFNILSNLPPTIFPLGKECLYLRQSITRKRQSLQFLTRFRDHNICPNFIKRKRIGHVLGLHESHPSVLKIYRSILRASIKQMRNTIFSSLKICETKENILQVSVGTPWLAFEAKSREICDVIRKEAKQRLTAKFNALLDREKGIDRITSTPGQSSGVQPDISVSRVTVLGGIQLSHESLSVLSLGPSFSTNRSLTASGINQIVASLQTVNDRLRAKMKFVQNPVTKSYVSVPFPASFYKQQSPFLQADTPFKLLATGIYSILAHHVTRRIRPNLTPGQIQGLVKVREDMRRGDIRISVSDKGGDFTVISSQLDREITLLHLSDTTLYMPANGAEYRKSVGRLNRAWLGATRSAGLNDHLITRLKLDKPLCPVLYTLIKTHKMSDADLNSTDPSDFKVRPIISGVGGPTDRISWFLHLILVQLLPKIPSHLSCTNDFLSSIREAKLTRRCVHESFDVTALYTNVSNADALQATHELLLEHSNNINLRGFSISSIMHVLAAVVESSIFQWSGQYYVQKRGLAMGQRLAPVLAIIYMSRIEKPVLVRNPIVYCRYIDDCYIVTSTQDEMTACFNLLNRQSDNISFTRESPNETWLPFLDTQVLLRKGRYAIKWYRKAASKNIVLHANSAHPYETKRAVVSNMFRRAITSSSGHEEKAESTKLAAVIAKQNGYNGKTTSRSRFRIQSGLQPVSKSSDRIPFCIPFVSDEVSHQVRKCVKRAGLYDHVVVVDISPHNLKRQLVRNRLYDRLCTTANCIICPHGRAGDCTLLGVIYQLQCLSCNALYIGETMRPLHKRIQEHMADKSKCDVAKPLGKHRIDSHGGSDFDVKVSILGCNNNIVERKTLESCFIVHNKPTMNRKDDNFKVVDDLTQFLPLGNFISS